MALRGAIIGCGFFARNHLHAWRDISGVALVACCDLDAGRAESARTEFAIPRAYTDAALMLREERLDFVDIATTMQTHRSLVELAVSHRLPVVVQKPLAPSWQDCLEMVAACARSGIWLAVHENFRFQAPILAARDVLASGAIGPVHFGRVSFRTNYDVFAGQPYLAREERLILLDLGVHVLDLARVFMGEVETVHCQTQQIRSGIAGEDMATMLLRHVGGGTSVVDCSYSSQLLPDPFPQTLVHLEGSRGSLRIEQDFRMVVVSDGVRGERDVASPPRAWTSPQWHVAQDSVFNTQRHFAECLMRGVPAETSGEDNLRTYALVMAAYRSAEEGRVVRPEPPVLPA